MNSENDLMQKLMISKQIMDKHNNMDRGNSRNINMNSEGVSSPMVESYEAPAAKYNIPQEFQQQAPQQTRSNGPIEDRIASSKLPDEIKRLMLEHPIQQPSMGLSTGSVLSEELIEKASRLMNTSPKGDPYKENQQQSKKVQTNYQSQIDINEIKKVVRETVEEVLQENGLLVESESKSSDMFKFRVGQHLFEGKVLNVKKMSK
jgi:flagellar biosynthesis/type III secretory pathway chaperone